MIRRPPRSTRTDTLFPYTTLFRSLRQNYLVVLNGGNLLIAVAIALVGFNKTWAIVALELNLLYQFFLHTEAPSVLNRFGAVLNTPSHHRVHHGANPAQIDRNFGDRKSTRLNSSH